MPTTQDILGLGSVAHDDIVVVDVWPEADAKVRVRSRERRLGGLTGHALMAAARFGARCGYAGRLGLDADSNAVVEEFSRAGVDSSNAPRDASFGIVRSVIIAAATGGTRNVFSHATGLTGAHPGSPDSEVIRAARVLLVDHHGVEGAIRAATIARSAGRFVVGDFERDDDPRLPELLALVDHLVLSATFARRWTKKSSCEEAALALWSDTRAAVIVTDGVNGCWILDGADRPARRHPALAVEVVDPSGCGDVFHGVYAALLARGAGLDECVRWAAAAAGLKAATTALPTRAEVEAAVLFGKWQSDFR
jgi:ribokinase